MRLTVARVLLFWNVERCERLVAGWLARLFLVLRGAEVVVRRAVVVRTLFAEEPMERDALWLIRGWVL